jgi:hypothetical protein
MARAIVLLLNSRTADLNCESPCTPSATVYCREKPFHLQFMLRSIHCRLIAIDAHCRKAKATDKYYCPTSSDACVITPLPIYAVFASCMHLELSTSVKVMRISFRPRAQKC